VPVERHRCGAVAQPADDEPPPRGTARLRYVEVLPDLSFSLGMLVARLVEGAASTVAAGVVATFGSLVPLTLLGARLLVPWAGSGGSRQASRQFTC